MKTTCADCEHDDCAMTTPPTPLHYATTSWLAVLRKSGLCLQNTSGTSWPTLDESGEALELTRRFVREWDAETELEKLGAQHGVDLALELPKGSSASMLDYEVCQVTEAPGYTVIGAGRTPAEAVTDAERELSS